MASKKTSTKDISTKATGTKATSTKQVTTALPYPGYEPYDVFQVYSEAGWTDYDSIRTERDAAHALKRVQSSRTGEYRIVSADKTLVKVTPSLQAQKPATKPKKAPVQAKSKSKATKVTTAHDAPTVAQQTATPAAPAPEPTSSEPTSGIEVTSVEVGEATLTERGKEIVEDLAEDRKERKARRKGTPATSEPAEPTAKKMSALDAAARVLEEAGQAMSVKELIDQMASKGYWCTPGGKTPAATLSAAIQREVKVKGADSRFRKTDRGRFARA